MLQVLNHPKLNHRVEVSSGVLAARCMDLVQTFFRERRASDGLTPTADTRREKLNQVK